MENAVINFIESQRVGVLAVAVPDGLVHGATVHFAHTEDPLSLIFMTSASSRKVEALQKGEVAATFVMGTDEEQMMTLQLDGVARLVDPEGAEAVYFNKFPEKMGRFPDGVFIVFTPNWWRFTDFKNSQGKKVLSSEDA